MDELLLVVRTTKNEEDVRVGKQDKVKRGRFGVIEELRGGG